VPASLRNNDGTSSSTSMSFRTSPPTASPRSSRRAASTTCRWCTRTSTLSVRQRRDADLLLCGRRGRVDARARVRRPVRRKHVHGLDNYMVCVRLLEGGRHAEPFIGRALPIAEHRYGRRENLIRRLC
jgi:hypothetical protein